MAKFLDENGVSILWGKVKEKISAEVGAVVNSAPEAFDTLKEVADWITNDETGERTTVTRTTADIGIFGYITDESTISNMYFDRKIDILLDEWLHSKNNCPALIVGIRQCGKTETIREFAKRNHLQLIDDLFSTLPFLRFVSDAVSSGSFSVEIYMESIGGLSYIIPNHILASLYFGDILCWLVEPLLIIINIKLLGWFERLLYKIDDLMQVYAVYSINTMVAMGVFCNNITLMLHSFSSLPLWLLIFSYVNNIGNKIRMKR